MYLINYLNSGSLSINFKSQDTKKAPKVRTSLLQPIRTVEMLRTLITTEGWEGEVKSIAKLLI